MGRPLSKQQLFGADANNNLKVQFHNGTQSVKGYIVEQTGSNVSILQSTPNTLGYIPAVCVYSTRSHIKGIGISDISDIADTQRAIYDELSEIEQLIRERSSVETADKYHAGDK